MFLHVLIQEYQSLCEQIDQLRAAIAAAPSGSLRTSTVRGKPRYYQTIKGEKAGGRYLGADEEDLIRRLAQKEYDRRVLSALEARAKRMRALIDSYEAVDVREMHNGLSPIRQALVEPFDVPDADFAETWAQQPFDAKDSAPEELAYLTDKGDSVRSKSEALIANALFRAGVAYRYEAPLHLRGLGTVHPDFTVLNARTRKVLYWEHFGMMDDDAYRMQALRRIEAYQRAGFRLGEHLIVTFEGRGMRFDTRTIGENISNYLT